MQYVGQNVDMNISGTIGCEFEDFGDRIQRKSDSINKGHKAVELFITGIPLDVFVLAQNNNNIHRLQTSIEIYSNYTAVRCKNNGDVELLTVRYC